MQKHCKYTLLVDYIKILIKDFNPAILEANPLLEFFDNINLSTGEIKTVNRTGQKITPYKNAFYNSLEFKIYDTGTITISGSLHKYYNAGAHNFNDFNFEAFSNVLNDLKEKFNITPEQCILKCLELGLNITPPKPTNEILEYCFLHKTKPFEYQKNSGEGKYKQCEHTQYIVKIYNKTLHYKKDFDIKKEIMRFEIKYTRMERLNKLGVFNLSDISKLGFKYFENELLTEWQNVLFFDTTINAKSKRLLNFQNPIYWCELIQKPTKTNYYKQKGILIDFTLNYSQKIQHQLTEIMSKKIDCLNYRGARFDTLIIKSIHAPQQLTKDNICIITGVNISMQKDNSILLSHSGLRYYFKNDKKIFEQIKRHYLSKTWTKANFETQIKEIAHNIRNHRSNQQIKQRRLYQPNQTNLFQYFGF
jgi:hypothetical protein